MLQTHLNLGVVAVLREFEPQASLRYRGVFFLTELMSCEELHSILHLVLQAGNIMNAVSKVQKKFFNVAFPTLFVCLKVCIYFFSFDLSSLGRVCWQCSRI